MEELELILVPDPDEPGTAQIFVEGNVGDHPYRFLLDTGAARSTVVADAYTSGFDATDSHTSSGVFKAHSEDVIVVPSLTVGSITLRDFPMVRTPANPHVTALIGMDVLKDYCGQFRFGERRVLLSRETVAHDDDWLPLTMDARNHPYLDVQFDSIAASAVWDTGASLTIVDASFIAQHPALFEQSGRSSGTDSTGAQVETPMYTMTGATIGGRSFPALRVAGVDLSGVNATIEIPMNLILGYNVLSQSNWIFDFPRRQWAFTP